RTALESLRSRPPCEAEEVGMKQGGEGTMPLRGACVPNEEPIKRSNEETLKFVQDLTVNGVDPEVRSFFGEPRFTALITFPNAPGEPVTWATNCEPLQRPKAAVAMALLLNSWGFDLRDLARIIGQPKQGQG